jgi:deoxyribonuclease IV
MEERGVSLPVVNIGGHLSLRRDPSRTVQWAADNGFGCMQIFASSPGAWRRPIVDELYAADFIRARVDHGIDPLFIHAIYLINLASGNPSFFSRAKSSLIATMEAAAEYQASAVITHIGSHAGRGFDAVTDQVARVLSEILDATPQSIRLLLENSAGQGGTIGSDMQELGDLIDRSGRDPRLGIALDTAHLCASGWDFKEDGVSDQLVDQVETHVGIERLAVVHCNDSANPVAARKDRHANIGEGHIGIEGFRRLLAQPALIRVPWILETPNLEERVDDLANLRALSVDPLTMPAPETAVALV